MEMTSTTTSYPTTTTTTTTTAPTETATTCPCKKLPWSLSSFTAAEYGDIHSLVKRNEQRDWNRADSAGYTPLHLAAQQNHVAATSLLLQLGANVDGGTPSSTTTVAVSTAAATATATKSTTSLEESTTSTTTTTTTNNNNNNSPSLHSVTGATPLHRASYSGATATMRVLIQYKANLLAKDTSFMDLKTPLHKAAAGGRYMAIQLLLDALRQQDLLVQGLTALDASSCTPLQVTIQQQQSYNDASSTTQLFSVARWDQIAGGVADWSKCIALLEAAQMECQLDTTTSTITTTMTVSTPSNPKASSSSSSSSLFPLSSHLDSLNGCLGCTNQNGVCLISSWQRAFQAALGQSVDSTLHCVMARNVNNPSSQSSVTFTTAPPSPATPLVSDTTTLSNAKVLDTPTTTIADEFTTIKMSNSTTATSPSSMREDKQCPSSSMGVVCSQCQQRSISLFRVGGTLVCQSCRRRKRIIP